MIRLEFKTTMINMLKALMDTIDSIQEEMDKEGRETCILKKKMSPKEIRKIKKLKQKERMQWLGFLVD